MNGAIETVFIVDDEGVVRSALSRLLAAAGYQVRAFESATRFLEQDAGQTAGCFRVAASGDTAPR